jgi:hypothetical protein
MSPYGSGVAALTDRCPVCGIDPRSVTSRDAVVALRSFPRRYRELLVRPAHGERPEIVTGRPPGGAWSALEHASHAAAVIDAVSDALLAVQVHDSPEVSLEAGPSWTASVEEVLVGLGLSCERLADAAAEISGASWNRTGRLVDGAEVTALDLMRHAVHVGAHHLRQAQHVVEQLT